MIEYAGCCDSSTSFGNLFAQDWIDILRKQLGGITARKIVLLKGFKINIADLVKATGTSKPFILKDSGETVPSPKSNIKKILGK